MVDYIGNFQFRGLEQRDLDQRYTARPRTSARPPKRNPPKAGGLSGRKASRQGSRRTSASSAVPPSPSMSSGSRYPQLPSSHPYHSRRASTDTMNVERAKRASIEYQNRIKRHKVAHHGSRASCSADDSKRHPPRRSIESVAIDARKSMDTFASEKRAMAARKSKEATRPKTLARPPRGVNSTTEKPTPSCQWATKKHSKTWNCFK
ncbi:hypothetical protein V2G26_020356 [Clonostachys chloroleuca]